MARSWSSLPTAAQPNERRQLDITHWALADGTDVEILNILDDHYRVCLGGDTLPVFKARDVDDSFGKAAASYGPVHDVGETASELRWRQDLNLRSVLADSRFQGECIRPLCHATVD